ncbi:MAG: septal ring lytic transglycosylase RlpA family protein [Mycobacteriales bacterium]
MIATGAVFCAAILSAGVATADTSIQAPPTSASSAPLDAPVAAQSAALLARPVTYSVLAAPAAAPVPPRVAPRKVSAARSGPAVRVIGPTYTGRASWYGPGFQGRRTANGERFDTYQLTAAHKTLPFGTRLRVCRAGRCVVVRVNDRGPYVRGRFLDLSKAAAQQIGVTEHGVCTVTATVVAVAPTTATTSSWAKAAA